MKQTQIVTPQKHKLSLCSAVIHTLGSLDELTFCICDSCEEYMWLLVNVLLVFNKQSYSNDSRSHHYQWF